jgi:SpoVK/Ycf46/Vps4 family AAA+-type ATPase
MAGRNKKGRETDPLILKLRQRRLSQENTDHLNEGDNFSHAKKLDYVIRSLEYAGTIPNENILGVALKFIIPEERKRLLRAAVSKAKKTRSLSAGTLEGLDRFSHKSEESLERLNNSERLKPFIYERVMAILRGSQARQEKTSEDNGVRKKLEAVSSIFGLGPTECEVLLFLYLYSTDSTVERLYDEMCTYLDVKNFSNAGRNTRLLSIMTGLSRSDLGKAFFEGSSLIKAGLLSDERELAPEVIEYLEGNSPTPITGKYFSEFSGETVPFEYHIVEKRHVETIRTIVSHKSAGQGINVLLYGMPGTGKTEFARALGEHLEKSVFEIKNISEETGRERNWSMFRSRALFACQRMVDLEKSIIIMDEADELLNTACSFFSSNTMEKGQINKILDDSKGVIVWITNLSDRIDESTMRRFDYSVGFDKLTFCQRKAVWQLGLEKHGLVDLLSAEDVERFATNYEISAGGIDIALRNAARIRAVGGDKATIVPVMDNIMKAHVKVIDEEKSPADLKKPNAPSYSLDGLNIKADMQSTIKLIDRFNHTWNGPVENMAIKNMNLLLYGPPGTGKTEFAKFVARTMDRRLMVRRASDLLSCYVGETEKLIWRAFSEAEKDKSILFIDEADSMLGTREGANYSWEISFVNEMLTNMETFHGMLICSTNFKKVVDSAAIRRFNIKLEFDYLTPQGAMTFYNLFLAGLPLLPPTDNDAARIGALSGLTPGDFKVVHQKFLLFDRGELTHQKLISGLEEELCSRNEHYGKKIGFAAA